MTETATINFSEQASEGTQGTTTETTAASERPSWLPENFKTTEEFVESAKQTKSALTQAQQELAEFKKSPSDTPKETEATTTEAAKDAVTKAGIDFDSLSNEYIEKGELSAETLKMLEDKGFSKNIVDTYINGVKASANQYEASMGEVVGGVENVEKVLTWARDNLTQEEITAYNAAVTKDPTTAKMQLAGIYSRFVKDNGKDPNLLTTEGVGNSSVYKSPHDYVKAMQDPRYFKGDPDYIKEVTEKAQRSHVAGTI
jgi:hypothetical protein